MQQNSLLHEGIRKMDKSIDLPAINTHENSITSLMTETDAVEFAFKGLVMKWNAMDYIHLITHLQTLIAQSIACGYDDIQQIASKIESLLTIYEYDIPAPPTEMETLSKMISELKARLL